METTAMGGVEIHNVGTDQYFADSMIGGPSQVTYADDENTQKFTYDGLNRLVSVQSGAGGTSFPCEPSITYDYDNRPTAIGWQSITYDYAEHWVSKTLSAVDARIYINQYYRLVLPGHRDEH